MTFSEQCAISVCLDDWISYIEENLEEHTTEDGCCWTDEGETLCRACENTGCIFKQYQSAKEARKISEQQTP